MSGPRSSFLVLAALALAGCPEPHGLPGDELIGTYAFVATRVPDAGCPGLSAVQAAGAATIEFVGTITRCAADSPSAACVSPQQAFLTVGVDDFDAGFDGQYLRVGTRTAERSFSECGPDRTTMAETIDMALLSASQRDALGAPFACPPNPLDGGVPAPDGGVVLPGPGPSGFDAVLACGQIAYSVVNPNFASGGGAGECRSDAGVPRLPGGRCDFVYTLRGERR